ncbi:hypothetical protein FACS189431_0920 [Alphaproteobacteria bacterium]|nr:hypothetical protein FACS189431_0920 [Alphaproteobacteria bacterium]
MTTAVMDVYAQYNSLPQMDKVEFSNVIESDRVKDEIATNTEVLKKRAADIDNKDVKWLSIDEFRTKFNTAAQALRAKNG